jgi:hypothetical protein
MCTNRSQGARTWIAVPMVALAILASACTNQSAVEPLTREMFLRRSDRFTLRADLGAIVRSHLPVDIAIVFDRTASMGNVIDEARQNARRILHDIRARYPNSAFAIAGIADYPGGESPWTVYQDFSENTEDVVSGLNAISLANGYDYPEAYATGLFEARSLRWRVGARRYLILFGDAPAHDPSFYGVDLGVDPGPDRIPGTSDDLHFEVVVNALADDSITAIAIYDGSKAKPFRAETLHGFDYLARQTRGVSLSLNDAAEVVDIIQVGMRRVLQEAPTLQSPSPFASWVQSDPFDRRDSTNTFTTRVSVHAPAAMCKGIYRFPLTVLRSGTNADTIGQTWVTMRIGILFFPWRWPLLLLFLLLTSLGILRRAARPVRRTGLYEGNRPVLGLLLRVAGFSLMAGTAWALWRFAPGTVHGPRNRALAPSTASVEDVGGAGKCPNTKPSPKGSLRGQTTSN